MIFDAVGLVFQLWSVSGADEGVGDPLCDLDWIGRAQAEHDGSAIHHLKELRPGSRGRSEIRIIFAFDPARSALLLLGGDKAGNWQRWYRDNIPIAERLYLEYTAQDEE